MDSKQYLNQISRLERQIKNKLDEIAQLRTMANGITALNDGDRVQTSGDKDKIGAIISRIVDMEREVDVMIDKRCKIVEQIESLENADYYDVLANIYILKKELKVIAIERGISYGHLKKVHGLALKEFERLYGMLYIETMIPNDTK